MDVPHARRRPPARSTPSCGRRARSVHTVHTRSQPGTRSDTNNGAGTGRRRSAVQESGDVDQRREVRGSGEDRSACCMDPLATQRRPFRALLFCLLCLSLTLTPTRVFIDLCLCAVGA